MKTVIITGAAAPAQQPHQSRVSHLQNCRSQPHITTLPRPCIPGAHRRGESWYRRHDDRFARFGARQHLKQLRDRAAVGHRVIHLENGDNFGALEALEEPQLPRVARHAVAEGICASISASTVRRWLAGDALKPWQHRSLDLPARSRLRREGRPSVGPLRRVLRREPLGENEFVVCADEKTSIQARCRCHPTLPPGKARMMRVEHEYERGGALPIWPPTTCTTPGDRPLEPKTGIEPFARLVAQVMTTEPYAPRDRVFWIVDNGSSHRGRASVNRMQSAWPTASWCTPAGTRLLVGPDRDLLLHRPAQGVYPQRLHRSRRPRRTAPPPSRLATTSRPTVRLDVHPHRPRPSPRPARPASTLAGRKPCPTPSRMTPDELTSATTKYL